MNRLRKIAYVVMWILLISGSAVLLGFSGIEQYNRPCRRIYITMDYGQADRLVFKDEIDSLIRRKTGRISGKPLGWLNIQNIENSIKTQPYIEKVHIYESLEGNIFVDIKQREPILRIINNKYENFYIDGSGRLLPTNPFFPARVLIANGNIEHSYLKNPNFRIETPISGDSICPDTLLLDLYKLSLFINRNSFLKAQVDQIYVTPQKEFELVPKVGNHIVMLGHADDLDEKFRKLLAFYQKGLNSIGWNKYYYINIKYKNQVVCSKVQ